MRKLISICCLILGLVFTPALFAEGEENRGSIQTEVTVIEAEVLALDYENRVARLGLPLGYEVSLAVSNDVTRLEDIEVGDRLIATYIASIMGELREPTEEELAQPYVEITDEVQAASNELPARAGGRVIRAVCTIEAMNRIMGSAMIMDSRGELHMLENIPSDRFDDVTLGQTVIITYTQAVAIGLEPRGSEASDEM